MRFPLCAALLLGACATTPSDLRREEPKAVFQTAKAEPVVEQCLAEAFANLGGPSVVHGEHGSTLIFGTGGITSLLIDVDPPTVTLRSSYPFTGRMRSRLTTCL